MSKKANQRRMRSQPAKPTKLAAKRRKRPSKLRTESWYARALNSIAITSTGRGDRVSGHWISQLNGSAE